jgi:hypothetical protein
MQRYSLVAKAAKGPLRQPKKIFLFLLPKNKGAKQKAYFFVCPCIFRPHPVAIMALCLRVYFVVNWAAGGCSFTFIVLPGSKFTF